MYVPRWHLFRLLNLIQQISSKSNALHLRCWAFFFNLEKTRLLSQAQHSPGSLAGLFSWWFHLGKIKSVPVGPAESGDSLGGGLFCWSSCDVALVMPYFCADRVADLFYLIDLTIFFLVGGKIGSRYLMIKNSGTSQYHFWQSWALSNYF